ncbi:hypothetical protein JCM1840_002494 [Sporobolomyces johnsonii]
MQTPGGRPAPTYSSSRVQQQPYPQPGTAKAPAPRGVAPGANTFRSGRGVARERWARLFGGPAYLEAGPSNRLVLSIRSGVPAEVDFALDRLIQVASLDPDLLRFSELPGLLDGLLGLMRDFLERRRADRARGAQALPAVMPSESREMVRRRAAEAALILRNLALEKKSIEPLLESKKLRRMICDVLEEGQVDGPEGEETTELRLYLLEVLEIIGEQIPLALPGHPLAPAADAEEDPSQPPPKPEPLDAPSVRLFPLVASLTRSSDRALLLAAFRCLTVLSLNDKSDSVFALLTFESLPPLPKPHPHPIQTAIELLPLADAELGSVILDFIYQHTLLPSNAAYFCARPELLHILRLVCTKFHIGARIEEVETDILQTSSDASTWYKSLPVRHPQLKKAAAADAAEGQLSPDELRQIIQQSEPERALSWMRLVYEADPDADVTQVSLWTAYKAQFEPFMGPNVPVMMPAQDVIKHSTDAHPTAMPVVTQEEGRKFVIKGIRLKNRPGSRGVYRCHWQGCSAPSGLDTPIALFQHVYNAHLALPEPPFACSWARCSYSTGQQDPSLRLAELSLHLRTHAPSLDFSVPGASISSSPLPELPVKLHHERYHAALDDNQEPTGMGYLACLVLRNIARTAKLALEAASAQGSSSGIAGRSSVASGNAAVGRLAEGEQSIFEAFAAAAEGTAKKDGVFSQLERVDYAIARPAVEAVVAVQDTLLKTALSDAALGKYLAEVVGIVEECRRQQKKAQVQASEA